MPPPTRSACSRCRPIGAERTSTRPPSMRSGILWFTGQAGVYGRLDPATGDDGGLRRSGGSRAVRHHRDPGRGRLVRLARRQPHRAHRPATGAATIVEPPTSGQGARRVWSDSRGRIWVSEWNAGQVGVYDPATGTWQEWRLPGRRPAGLRRLRRRARHRLADRLRRQRDRPLRPGDRVVRRRSSCRARAPSVRQLLGRPGEVWGAESATDKLVVITED